MLNGIFSKVAGVVIALMMSAAAAENLRSQVDTARDRVWVLTRSGVQIYDLKSGLKTRDIALPDWIWAGEPYGCSPDLALGPTGDALISSDTLPTLWRVDGVTMRVSMHELVLDDERDKDVGFSGLAYSAEQGAFFGVSCSQGSLWRIDPLLGRARKIPLSAPLTRASGLFVRPRVFQQKTSRVVGFCARAAQGAWTINLAPDQRSGYVFAQPCTN
ncbi:MAG: hypothetical protein AABM33_01250 [Pseudomonadota bacterium]